MQQLQAAFGVAGRDGGEAVLAQVQLQQPPHLGLVFDDEEAGFHAPLPFSATVVSAAGRKITKQAPAPGALSRRMLPRCSSTILDTILSPSPTPFCLVVTKGLKICSRSSA